MEITNEAVAPFRRGGQAEIQNARGAYLYRGEIEEIVVHEDEWLYIKFRWLAHGVGFPPVPTGWEANDSLVRWFYLSLFIVEDIGPSGNEIGGDSRLCLHSSFIGETVVLFPPNGSRLDPSKVKGLLLS